VLRGMRASRASAPASGRDLGLMAAVGLAVCCGLPLLVGAGTLAAAGQLLASPVLLSAGVALALAGLVAGIRRRRVGRAACCLRPPVDGGLAGDTTVSDPAASEPTARRDT
jgi:hypothetical protein